MSVTAPRLASRLIVAALACLSCEGRVMRDDPRGPAPVAGAAGANSAGDPATPGGSPGASVGTDAPAPDRSSASRGPFDCPTVDYPGTRAAAPTLSSAFRDGCASCHGGAGEGQGPYPTLPGKLTADEFVAKVRQGSRNMPAYTTGFVSDDVLRTDYAALAKRAATASLPTEHPALRWSDQEVSDRYTAGLVAWRKGDARGAACASCHSPDAIDLALIGYPDSTILRRAGQHLAIEDARKVVDFVHAQRRRFAITRPCAPSWRPFQPGGEPLPGNTVEQQEMSFAAHLASLKLTVAVGRVDGLADAIKARDELLAIDLRKLRIGIPLPRWTEDMFNGPEHRSIVDWIPENPRIPNDARWYALQDAYLADPSDANLFKLIDAYAQLTNDGGMAADFEAHQTVGARNWMGEAMPIKFETVLLGSHHFRLELLKRPGGWFDRPRVPYADEVDGWMNPYFQVAQHSLSAPCANDKECNRTYHLQLPSPLIDEAKAYDDASEFIASLSHPFFTLGQLLDQGLLLSGGAGHNTTEAIYWNAEHFPHNHVHKPFFSIHRTFVQTQMMTAKGNTGLAPLVRGDPNSPVPALLHGKWCRLTGLDVPKDPADPRGEVAAKLKTNALRTLLLLMREQLQKGAPVSVRSELLASFEKWRTLPLQIDSYLGNAAWAQRWPAIAKERAYYVDGTTALLDEVTKLVNAAPEQESPGP